MEAFCMGEELCSQQIQTVKCESLPQAHVAVHVLQACLSGTQNNAGCCRCSWLPTITRSPVMEDTTHLGFRTQKINLELTRKFSRYSSSLSAGRCNAGFSLGIKASVAFLRPRLFMLQY